MNCNCSFTVGQRYFQLWKGCGVKLKADKFHTLTWRWTLLWMAEEAETACNVHEKITCSVDEFPSWGVELEIINKAPNLYSQAMVVSKNVPVPFAWVVGTIRGKTSPPAVG